MKALLLLCLIALISCNVIDAFTCLSQQPKLVELVFKVISYVTSKDYTKILPALLGSVADIIDAFKTCFAQ